MKNSEKVDFDQLEKEYSELEKKLNEKRLALSEAAKAEMFHHLGWAMNAWSRIHENARRQIIASKEFSDAMKEWSIGGRKNALAANGAKKKRLTDDHILEALEDGRMHYTTELLDLFESQNFRISDQSLTPKLKALEKKKLIASQKEGTRLQWWKL